MALKSTFSQADIRRVLEASLRHINTGILQSMKKLGAESVKIARDKANAIDPTGQLAQSIGYVIVADGLVIERAFDQKPVEMVENLPDNTTDTSKNEAQTGENFAEALAAKYPKGYALIVVSGSDYAVQAESLSKDVLTSAEMYVGEKLPSLLEELLKKSF